MSKETQKAARRRRKDRQRTLMETGKKAEDLVLAAGRQAQETAGKLAKLEAEVDSARRELGLATAELAAVRRELAARITLLAGLEDELKAASETVKIMEAGKDEVVRQLGKVRGELIDLKQTDRDTKSLRSRLQRKSEEIIKLGAKVRELRAFLDEKRLLNAFDARHPGATEEVKDV